MVGLGYANGANDVAKAIATLVGSGVTDYPRAIRWGTAGTVAGGLAALFLGTGLISTFTKGLIASAAPLTAPFALAALIGTIAWVGLATRWSLPVSTTHAITGAVVATGALAYGGAAVQWSTLGGKILLPLLVSPVLAIGLGWLLERLIRAGGPRLPLDGAHWVASGVVAFTRGLNDTPKVVALGAIFFLLSAPSAGATGPPWWLFVLVAGAMGLGSLVGGRRVTTTLAERVTRLDPAGGFAANLATALLVGAASPLGVPVSTTHVSSGAILGVGLWQGRHQVQWRTVRDMALAWLVTLPMAGLLGMGSYWLLAQ